MNERTCDWAYPRPHASPDAPDVYCQRGSGHDGVHRCGGIEWENRRCARPSCQGWESDHKTTAPHGCKSEHCSCPAFLIDDDMPLAGTGPAGPLTNGVIVLGDDPRRAPTTVLAEADYVILVGEAGAKVVKNRWGLVDFELRMYGDFPPVSDEEAAAEGYRDRLESLMSMAEAFMHFFDQAHVPADTEDMFRDEIARARVYLADQR